LADTDERRDTKTEIKTSGPGGVSSIWGIRYIKRKLEERKAKRENEAPADKAIRVTATATVWMAVFTCLLFLVTAGTYIEIKNGGTDTHDLAVAAGKQADRMKDFADRMKDQADRTKTIAEQAIVQAAAATTASNTAVSALKQSAKTFLSEQRPYIWVDHIQVRTVVVGQPLRYDVYFANSGKTPASSIALYTEVGFGRPIEELCDKLQVTPNTIGSGFLGSGRNDFWKTAVSVEDSAARESRIKNWNGEMPIAVYGAVYYGDFLSSGRTHTSIYCAEMLHTNTPLFSSARQNHME
jgi:hypothetical protein